MSYYRIWLASFWICVSSWSYEIFQLQRYICLICLDNDELRAIIIQKSPLWLSNATFSEIQPSLNNIALRLKSHGTQLLITASKMADQHVWCQDFLEFSLQELEQIVLSARLCPLMDDLVTENTKYMLWKSSLSTNIYEQQTAVRLLLIVCKYIRITFFLL